VGITKQEQWLFLNLQGEDMHSRIGLIVIVEVEC
jgi:hypothetical protein